MKAVAIIQARMGSTRLPGKCMLPLAHRTALWWCVERVKMAHQTLCVATTTNPADQYIMDYCQQQWGDTVSVYRGSEDDVLGRTLEAADFMGADVIIDVTSDCPLVDYRHIWQCIERVRLHGCDYASNVFPRQWPDGLDVQVYTIDAIRRAHKHPDAIREHSGWNIIQLRDRLGVKCRGLRCSSEEYMPEERITLDTPQDHDRIWRCLDCLVRSYEMSFSAQDVCGWIGRERDERQA